MDTPPVEYLRECFAYDPETGLFRWHARPKQHFPNDGAWLSWNARFASKRAFTTINSNGYAIGRVSYKDRAINLCARRVAWALSHGRYPGNLVQPINGCGSDCRLTNLREVTRLQSSWISKLPKGDLPWGVARSGKRFAARIRRRGADTYLGTFDTPEEASAAWQAAAKETRGQFLRSA